MARQKQSVGLAKARIRRARPAAGRAQAQDHRNPRTSDGRRVCGGAVILKIALLPITDNVALASRDTVIGRTTRYA
jgi:hypothetical protein